MKSHEQAVFRFGAFVLVPSERLLLRDGKPVSLTGKAFDLLTVLVENAGRLVGKDELMERVWPGVVVEEVNLSVNVSAVRKALGRSADDDAWLETIPRRGYRFNAPVEVADVSTVALGDARPTRSRSPAWRWLAPAVVGAVLIAGAIATFSWQAVKASGAYTSVVVLPFVADSPANEYLADGITEATINALAGVKSLRVTPRGSSFLFKGSADPLRAGRQLGVTSLVTGSIAQRGDVVRLQVELIDVEQGTQVWGAGYYGSGAELMGLQALAMFELARAMHIPFAKREGAGFGKAPTDNFEAYQAYLQGRFLWNQRSEKALEKAMGHFQRAVELDPRFALAYSGLADTITTLGYLGWKPPVSTFPIARTHALKALELDPALPEAHASLGYIKLYFDWDWRGAEQELKQAIALNPANPVSHQWYAVYLLAAGRPEEGLREVRLAQQLDPLSLAINTDVGFHHYYGRRYEDAIRQLKAVVGMKADFLLAHLWLGRTYVEVGRFDEALAELTQLDGKLGEWPVLVAARGYAHGVTGNGRAALDELKRMDALAKNRFVTAYGRALVYAGMNRKDEAFTWLEKAFDERSHWLVWLRLDQRWNNLRSDPRFPALVARMQYPTVPSRSPK